MPQRELEATKVSCSVMKTNKIDCGQVQINNGSQPFTVTNSEGKVVFFVDDKGVTEHITNSTTSFVELYDTPRELGKENTVLGIKKGKLAFIDDIDADVVQFKKMTCVNGSVDTFKTEKLDAETCCMTNLNCDKSYTKTSKIEKLNATAITCNEFNVTKFEPETLNCCSAQIKDLKNTAIQSDLISCHNFASTHAVLENLEAHKTKLDTAEVKTFKGESVISKELTTDVIKAKMLTVTDVISENVDAKVIKANKISVKQNIYGSEREPLCLAVTQTKDVKVEGYNIKIITKCPPGVLSQSFKIHGLDTEGDYIAHVTSNNDVMLQYMLVNDGNSYKLNINYAERALRETVLKIYIQRI